MIKTDCVLCVCVMMQMDDCNLWRIQDFHKGDAERDLGDRSPPAGSRGGAPVRVWAPEAKKHDVNFALRITLVNA